MVDQGGPMVGQGGPSLFLRAYARKTMGPPLGNWSAPRSTFKIRNS